MLFDREFKWSRVEGGFRVVSAGPRTERDCGVIHPLGIAVFHLENDEELFKLRPAEPSRRLVTYQPFKKSGEVYSAFAGLVKDENSAVEFSNMYGPLTLDGFDPDVGDKLDLYLANAEAMRKLIAARTAGGERLNRMLRGRGLKFGDVSFRLAFSDGLPAPMLVPNDLLGAMWLQLAAELIDGKIKSCRLCGQPFSAGAGKSRRRDSDYCCDAHRIEFNSKKRSIKK